MSNVKTKVKLLRYQRGICVLWLEVVTTPDIFIVGTSDVLKDIRRHPDWTVSERRLKTEALHSRLSVITWR